MEPFINKFIEKMTSKSFYVGEQSSYDAERYSNRQETGSVQMLDPLNRLNGQAASHSDYSLIEQDLNRMSLNIIDSITNGIQGSGEYAGGPTQLTHPLLKSIGTYYFEMKGKRIRPTVLLLLARAITSNDCPSEPISESQLKLAQVVEMLHTASLVHDDVIDGADTRREMASVNCAYSNKLAILCGNFLTARTIVLLSTLRNHHVTELVSNIISDLVDGELMQIKSNSTSFESYIRKTYLKTASLFANGCRSIAVLSGADANMTNMATEFGKNLGLAFQIIDDLLDVTGSSESLGKPASVDMSLGLATAPVLFALEEYPDLEVLINRKFSESGDVDIANQLVLKSNAIEKTKSLAIEYCNKSIEFLMKLPQSQSRDLLITLTQSKVIRFDLIGLKSTISMSLFVKCSVLIIDGIGCRI
ncbi:hypothetical protein PPL_08108 [Heterostelium album PN500]|uniref:Uncharacterized protein n=1 Tax=Heterostelium pallidum (strain ATCC 26659 / Pp 5 / PN500) TaxID=670386 RepID=D3BIM9_HETP5|nr:hypothetical protein PPL_08108 [Heterostelium album PN500]EFA78653.1 hypothetical protein PPL_08108 [Heterostelium album PN500]|eukprot:XP_020430777.1 hypothetical protein PPL_08108 [Heterostelium album PN500]